MMKNILNIKYIFFLSVYFIISCDSIIAQHFIECPREEPDRDIFLSTEPTQCSVFGTTFPVANPFQIVSGNSTTEISVSDLISKNKNVTFTSKRIHITGDINIDQSVTFNDCWIEIDGGKGLRTSGSGTVLSFNSCHIFSCGTMWKGIEIATGNTINFKYNIIEDAQFALRINDNVNATITGSTFNRNNFGVTNYGLSHTSKPGINFYSFYGNTFKCNSPLSTQYSGQTPATIVNRSYVGIELEKSSKIVVLGNVNLSSINLFDNLLNGIITRECSFIIQKTRFTNIRISSSYFQTGSAIVTYQGVLVVYGLGNSSGSTTTFENIEAFCIKSERTILGITGCYFKYFNYGGIFSEDNLITQNITINNNRFINTGITTGEGAINIQRQEGGKDEITNNTIYIPNGDACIYVDEGTEFGTSLNISDNHVQIDYGGQGIYIETPCKLNTTINSNTVLLATDSKFYGIYINGQNTQTTTGYLKFNSVLKSTLTTYTPSPYVANEDHLLDAGIFINNTKNFQICDNTVRNFGKGILFDNQCDGTNLRWNKINENLIGLFLSTSAQFMNVQDHNGNLWKLPTNYTTAALAKGSSSKLSKFIVNSNETPPTNTVYLPYPVMPSNWFYDVTIGDNKEYCDAGYSGYTYADTLLINGSYDTIVNNPVFKWESNRSLYAKAKKIGFSGNALVSGFVSATSSTNIHDFWVVDTLIEYYSTLTNSIQSNLENLYNIMIVSSDTIQNDTLYSALVDSAYTSYDRYFTYANNTIRSLSSNLNSVRSNNRTISTTTLYEEYRKKVNDNLLFKLIYPDSINTYLDSVLLEIALDCFENGGNATLQAKSLFKDCDYRNSYLYGNQCIEDRSNKFSQVEHKLTDLRIMPNPGSNYVKISSLTNNFNTDFKIFNIFGNSQKNNIKYKFSGSELYIDTSELQNGLYILVMKETNNEISSFKFIIQH